MPREDRKIIFEKAEVYKALFALCDKKQMPKPSPGLITKIVEDEKDPSKIYIFTENPQIETKNKEEYSKDFLAAALMLFCTGLGIPLPKKAKKSVLIKDGEAILRVTM